MRRSPRIIPSIALVVIILVMAALPPATAMTRREQRLLHLVNHLRVRYDLPRLRNDTDVTRDAHRHSWRMADANYLYHSSNLEAVVGRAADAWGENIAKARRVGKVFRLWAHSAGHRANMLNRRYRHAGIGIVERRGYLWATMIFYG
jgi:uncharacterized protein YkwD